MFFPQDLKCPFQNNCTVDTVTRRFCQRCRLKKCLDIGMKKEWIMSEEEKKKKKEKIEANKIRKLVDPAPYKPVSSNSRDGIQFAASPSNVKLEMQLPLSVAPLSSSTVHRSGGGDIIDENPGSVPPFSPPSSHHQPQGSPLSSSESKERLYNQQLQETYTKTSPVPSLLPFSNEMQSNKPQAVVIGMVRSTEGPPAGKINKGSSQKDVHSPFTSVRNDETSAQEPVPSISEDHPQPSSSDHFSLVSRSVSYSSHESVAAHPLNFSTGVSFHHPPGPLYSSSYDFSHLNHKSASSSPVPHHHEQDASISTSKTPTNSTRSLIAENLFGYSEKETKNEHPICQFNHQQSARNYLQEATLPVSPTCSVDEEVPSHDLQRDATPPKQCSASKIIEEYQQKLGFKGNMSELLRSQFNISEGKKNF